MPLVKGKGILVEARQEERAVAGLDIFSVESAQAAVVAAEKVGTPVFLQVYPPTVDHMGGACIACILKQVAKASTVPVAIHLDHGPNGSSLQMIDEALELGFTSVMYDGSELSFEENVENTRRVVQMAHRYEVSVEGELGYVSRDTAAKDSEIKDLMTVPEQAEKFVAYTGIDYLAVSVGSVSGFFRGSISLDLERLKEISRRVLVPLVFHGGTSIPPEQVRAAIEMGVSKINVAHGYWKTSVCAFRETLEQDPEETDPSIILPRVRAALEGFAESRIRAYARR